jgi:hypothetical protein
LASERASFAAVGQPNLDRILEGIRESGLGSRDPLLHRAVAAYPTHFDTVIILAFPKK